MTDDDASKRVLPSDFADTKVGDRVIRVLAGSVHMPLTVSAVTDELICCGPWTFDRKTGAEIDDLLEWGVHGTGSILRRETH